MNLRSPHLLVLTGGEAGAFSPRGTKRLRPSRGGTRYPDQNPLGPVTLSPGSGGFVLMEGATMPRKHGVKMRTYLAIQVMHRTGCNQFVAIESVCSTALAHPEWDLDEKRTWEEWSNYHAELEKESNE